MKQSTPKYYKFKRVTRIPYRIPQEFEVLTSGLDFSKNPEEIDKKALSECDGFIIYSGVLRKDWNVTDSANVPCDNIVITVKASVPACLE